jgi:hypothetical protein
LPGTHVGERLPGTLAERLAKLWRVNVREPNGV